MPVGTVREIYPFSQLIEIPDMEEPLELELDCGIEQLAAVMLDQEHIEVKAIVHLELLAILKQQVNNIEELEETALISQRREMSFGILQRRTIRQSVIFWRRTDGRKRSLQREILF